MSPEKQRIAIGEYCGWKCTAAFKEAFACWVRPGNTDFQTEWLPDYLGDLNEIREAERNLTDAQRKDYVLILFQKVLGFIPNPDEICRQDIFAIRHATASECAESILKAIKKWEE